ncbi:hypothetical protein K439DRAFT_1402857 [Ramaria rubella]|nr:hypothetical protein K439DRAFT_1402857 [Ramaria rubella]
MSDLFTTSRGSLETKLFSPSDEANVATRLAVFTHPWSPLGGSMHDPVLQVLRPVFLSRGFHVLLYNARFSFTGVSEAEDLKELVMGTMNTLGDQINCVVLLGYSHGSLISSLHPLLPPPIKTYHILLSYPMSVRGLITFFRGPTYEAALKNLVQHPGSDILVLYGDHDQFTSVQRYERWLSELESETKGQFNSVMIQGGDHFWRGRAEEEMSNTVAGWLDEI